MKLTQSTLRARVLEDYTHSRSVYLIITVKSSKILAVGVLPVFAFCTLEFLSLAPYALGRILIRVLERIHVALLGTHHSNQTQPSLSDVILNMLWFSLLI